jgi:hypothetical protein
LPCFKKIKISRQDRSFDLVKLSVPLLAIVVNTLN